jgi:hypothetical protein
VGSRAGWTQRVYEKSSTSIGDRTPLAQSPVSHYTKLFGKNKKLVLYFTSSCNAMKTILTWQVEDVDARSASCESGS